MVNGAASLTTRRAGPGDAEAIADVYLAARADALPHLPRLQTDAELRSYLAGLLDNPAYAAWICEQDGLLLGFIVLRDDWVDHLYVRPGWYRRGIGTRLLNLAKRCRPHGLRLFCSTCAERARRFYEARGLVVVRAADGSGNGAHEPDLEYWWAG